MKFGLYFLFKNNNNHMKWLIPLWF